MTACIWLRFAEVAREAGVRDTAFSSFDDALESRCTVSWLGRLKSAPGQEPDAVS